MRNDKSCPISMAACAQLPHAAEGKPLDAHMAGRQRSRAADILTISDDSFLAAYLSRLFQRSGWQVAGTRTRDAAISSLNARRAAVAVCDETLPDGSWRDVAGALGALQEAPALVVIGHDESLVQEVLEAGGFDAMIKPLRDVDVVWTVASAWHAWLKRFEDDGNGGFRCSDA